MDVYFGATGFYLHLSLFRSITLFLLSLLNNALLEWFQSVAEVLVIKNQPVFVGMDLLSIFGGYWAVVINCDGERCACERLRDIKGKLKAG